MKKIISLLFVLPIVVSCNHDSSFVNPFPNDKYEKIGFKIADDERITRVLTTKENEILDNTISNINFYDTFIMSRTSEIHERNYSLARGGVFSSGYQTSDLLSDKVTSTKRYFKNEDVKNSHRRLITNETSNIEEHFTYGSINKNETVNTYRHEEGNVYGEEGEYIDEDPSKSIGKLFDRVETIRGKVTDVTQEKDSFFEYNPSDEKELIEKPSDSYFVISQKDYIEKADIHSGADDNKNIILISEKQEPYPGETLGRIKLGDLKEYCALQNSITVSKLTYQSGQEKSEGEEEIKPWYLASYVRKYTETVITSEIIEPNVPIKLLDSPILINFVEEIHRFSVDKNGESTQDLPKIDEDLK